MIPYLPLELVLHIRVDLPDGVMQNYEEALRIAEAREREVRSFFDKFDVDGSGTIDMEEILAIMEEMGLLKNLKTDRITCNLAWFPAVPQQW